MEIDTLEDLAKELKSGKTTNAMKLFEDYAKANNMDEEELEQILSKKHDCFKCESCESFYCYDEFSFFDEECIYCCDTEAEDEEEF